jgi:hypothetical protein
MKFLQEKVHDSREDEFGGLSVFIRNELIVGGDFILTGAVVLTSVVK